MLASRMDKKCEGRNEEEREQKFPSHAPEETHDFNGQQMEVNWT